MLGIAHELSVDPNLARFVGFEEVDAAQQRALARAAGAEHTANGALGHGQGDAVDDAAGAQSLLPAGGLRPKAAPPSPGVAPGLRAGPATPPNPLQPIPT